MKSTCLIAAACLLGIATTGSSLPSHVKLRDCSHAKSLGHTANGTYHIWVNETQPVKLRCEFWGDAAYTVILRRVSTNENFYRGWADYVNGFGNTQENYWAGLNTINYLTSVSHQNILTINMQDWLGNNQNARYTNFYVADSRSNYQLTVYGFSGTVADDLSYNSGRQFATYDRPDVNKCASYQKGGWWYNYCTYTLPTGIYYVGGKYVPPGTMADGIFWTHWLGVDYSLKFFQMVLSNV